METNDLRNALYLLMQGPQEQTTPVDPRIAWHRAGANADEAMGMNALQRLLGINLSPRVGVSQMFQSDVPPQNRIQESFRQFPGYY